ncbi:MAG: SpaA isopeptide-forming pilin-related protein [Bacillota bacterium]|nr:SpaA isopeptide-forming pilin-related protein [Bacillota bacterium]
MRLNYDLRRRRTIVFILVFVMLAAVMWTGSSFAALTAGKSGKSTWVYMGAGKDGKAYKSVNTGNKQPRYTVKVGGGSYVGYCINPDKGWGTGTKMTARSFEVSKALSKIPKQRQELLSYVLLYGFNKGKSAPFGNSNDYYAATQALVWQVLQGNVIMNEEGDWTQNSTSDKKYKLIKGHSYGVKCYNHIKQEISKHVKCASFASRTEDETTAKVMKYNYKTKRWSISQEDSVKGNYLKKVGGSRELSMNRSGYKYTFATGEAGNYKAVLMNDRNYGTGQSAMVFDSSNSGIQSVALGATDMKKFYAVFTTEKEGHGKIVKIDEKGNRMAGFSFRITCDENGYDETLTTDDNGEISVVLFPGEYIVNEVLTSEQLKDKWNQAEPVKLIVKEGETSVVEIKNTRDKSASLKIIKQNSDGGPCGGFKFRVEGILDDAESLTEEKIISSVNPQYSDEDYKVKEWFIEDKDVIDHINRDAAAGKRGGYIVKIAGKAVLVNKDNEKVSDSTESTESKTDSSDGNTGDSGDRKDGDEDSNKHPSEETKAKPDSIELQLEAMVKLRGVKDDKKEPVKKNQNGIISRDFTWNGGATVLNKVYETDSDGIIAIKNVAYGTYTITEEMNEHQKKRYSEPKSQKVKIDENNQTDIMPFVFENMAKEGRVKVIKKSLDGQIADVSFKITGTTAWGERATDVIGVTDADGIADFGYLPAGDYTVEEINVDLEKYDPVQPQKFKITGDEKADSVIELKFENIRKSDLLISKKDAVTGGELAGAKLQLIDKETGEIIDEWISGNEPHLIKGLRYGQVVILKELLPPVIVTDAKRGYMNSEGKYVTGFDKAEKIEITVGSVEKAVMVDEPTQVVVSKRDDKTSKYLAGAILNIIDPESNEMIHEWVTTDEPHVIEGLVKGKRYVVKEVKAPMGYELAEDVSFVPGKDNEIVIIDKPSISAAVKTGDNTRMWIPVAAGMICLLSIGIATLLIITRRRR